MIRDRVIDLRRVPASQIDGAPWNWRTHGDAQRAAVAASLEELGMIDALRVRELPGGRYQLFDGHLRQELLNAAGPETLVPVIIVGIDEAEAKKANAIFDPLANLAGVDAIKLDDLRRTLAFDHTELDRVLADVLKANPIIDIFEDDIPAPPDKAITQPGDLWILGQHRLLCSDSSSLQDVDRLLDGALIHMVNTDPPYNVKVEPRSNNAIAAGLSSFQGTTHHQGLDLARHPGKSKPTQKQMRAKDRPLMNDFISDSAFDDLLAACFGNMARVLVLGGAFYIWGGYANLGNYPLVLKQCGLYFSQGIVWDKQWPVLTRKDFMGAFEICFYGWREGGAHRFYGPSNVTDLWHVKKVNPQSMEHLTQKPVELAVRAMQYSSRSGENVLDLFGGSGSTLIAAEQADRRAFLMELDPPYCDVIIQRFEKLSGRKAERLATAGVAT